MNELDLAKETGMSSQQTYAPASWTFLSNHGHVLVCLAHDPTARLRDVANWVGITERAVQKIVADLESAGVLTRSRAGRCNRYQIHPEQPLRHSVEAHQTVGALLAMVLSHPEGG
jgi:DNA-binding MarR family transcriptional regulator